jgi:adenylate kinase
MPVIDVNVLVEQLGLATGYDRKRKTKEVDVARLARAVDKMEGNMILEGHFSHLLNPDIAIVLRCSPKVLEERLRKKGWAESKVRENVEAEAVDVVLIESLENVPEVCEMDTTRLSVEQVSRGIENILAGERQKYRVGNVDWSQEVLSWF